MSSIKDPYLKMKNLSEWVEDRQARKEVGLVGGKIIFKGQKMSKKKFYSIEPVQLEYDTIHIPANQISR